LTWRRRDMRAGPSYWEAMSSERPTRGGGLGLSAVTTTPTATAILVQEWDRGSFPITSGGRLRKRSKRNITGSANWPQEMMARMVLQRNPSLLPTAEACEEFMMIPTGWTDLGAAGTASYGSSPQSSEPTSPRPGKEGKMETEETRTGAEAGGQAAPPAPAGQAQAVPRARRPRAKGEWAFISKRVLARLDRQPSNLQSLEKRLVEVKHIVKEGLTEQAELEEAIAAFKGVRAKGGPQPPERRPAKAKTLS